MGRRRFLVRDGCGTQRIDGAKLIEVDGEHFCEITKADDWKGRTTVHIWSDFTVYDDYEIIVEVSEDTAKEMRREYDRRRHRHKQNKKITIVPYEDERIDEFEDEGIYINIRKQVAASSPVETEILRKQQLQLLCDAIKVCLSLEEWKILSLRYCEDKPYTYIEIGKKLNLSRKQVARREKHSLKKIRIYMQENGNDNG